MRLFLVWLCLAPLLGRADVVLVDRVVAAVDLHPITRSAVEERARPALAAAKAQAQQDAARRAALLELIEEQLIRKEAQRLRIEVREEEVGTALQEVANQNQLTVAELLVEVKKQGLREDQYRSMLSAKLLELRWLNQRMNREALPAEQIARGAWLASERSRLVDELRAAAVIEVRL